MTARNVTAPTVVNLTAERIRRIKKTRLGNLWVRELASIVWASMSRAERRALLGARTPTPFGGFRYDVKSKDTRVHIWVCGSSASLLTVQTLHHRGVVENPTWPLAFLSPLGLEVYWHGRRVCGCRT